MAKKRANGEGNIRKRADGRWEGRYTAGYHPETGKRIIKNVLGKTQAECKAKLSAAMEATRGIDVNAKHEIYELIRKLADEGKSIIFISSELPEILKLSDRIIVMYEGKITGEINAAEATEDAVIHYAVGG